MNYLSKAPTLYHTELHVQYIEHSFTLYECWIWFSGFSVILTTDMLSAWDDRSSAESIQFTVTSAPKNGYLELLGAPGRRLSTFTQIDLAAGRIKYSHDGNERQLSDAFEFEVSF